MLKGVSVCVYVLCAYSGSLHVSTPAVLYVVTGRHQSKSPMKSCLTDVSLLSVSLVVEYIDLALCCLSLTLSSLSVSPSLSFQFTLLLKFTVLSSDNTLFRLPVLLSYLCFFCFCHSGRVFPWLCYTSHSQIRLCSVKRPGEMDSW